MATRKTKFAVGLFVVIGLSIAVTMIIWIGASNILRTGKHYAAYFDESIQGLSKDSAVKYRGVTIGRVHSVGLAPDSTLIEVILSIDADIILDASMVAQLKSVGITGLVFIEIDRKDPSEIIRELPIQFSPRYPLVTTKPSGMKLFMDGMAEVRNFIEGLDSKGLSEKMKISIDNLNRTLENANKTVEGLNVIITGNQQEINEAFVSLKRSITNTDLFLQEGVDLLKRSNTNITGIQGHLLTTLQNLEKASENLNTFINIISDHPAQLLFGQPPPSRDVGSGRR